MDISKAIRQASELHNPEVYRRANAIGHTKRWLAYLRKRQTEVSSRSSMGFGLLAYEMMKRLDYLKRGYLERGWLDDVFNEHGDIADE